MKSDNLWLYKALNVPGSPGNDIRKVLQARNLRDFNCENPSSIRRKYRAAKKALAKEMNEFELEN